MDSTTIRHVKPGPRLREHDRELRASNELWRSPVARGSGDLVSTYKVESICGDACISRCLNQYFICIYIYILCIYIYT